jgi:predicted nucleic acid-binding protein
LSFLIDTNIISEVRKGERCNAAVASWWRGVSEDELWLSTLVLGEIRKGIELARAKDTAKSKALEQWLAAVLAGFADRVLPVDSRVADEWGRLTALRPLPVIDGLLAATARANGLILVTRNEADVAGIGVDVLNPFST